MSAKPHQIQSDMEDFASRIDAAADQARKGLLTRQHDDGRWHFELEADCTIPAEYILMMHYMDEIDAALQARIAAYLRRWQMKEGGWPLYYGGEMDISCSVKAYYALKMAGDSPEDEHMARAREAILERGGAVNANVFTHVTLALFGQMPWRGVPYIPVEIMLVPKWFFIHLSKVSYWSRTTMVPLFILCTYKPRAKNPGGIGVSELFVTPAFEERGYFNIRSPMNRFYVTLDKVGRSLVDPLIPKKLRQKATRKAEEWFIERLNGEDGLGAIFPAMVNAYEALHLLGYPHDHPYCVQARNALKHLVVERGDEAYVQPAVSPVWDTCLSCNALQAEAGGATSPQVEKALDWLKSLQVLDGHADWRDQHPGLAPGGWAFQYANPHYPDLDDTAAVSWAMHQSGLERFGEPIDRAADWLAGMQSRNGGYGAFDSDNDHYHLNDIPFADHGALLDPPTADVSARVLAFLGRLQRPQDRSTRERCLEYLKREQEPEGSWWGRWGTNYLYGTWSVLAALEQAGADMQAPFVRRAVDWIKSMQREDGGWGEDNDTYEIPPKGRQGYESMSFSTAWAVMGLMAAGEARSPEAARGVEYLMSTQAEDGLWYEPWFSAPGFPRVFYLKYHGYSAYFPVWALGRYRRLLQARD